MRKLILILLLTSTLHAQDITITITIPSAKVEEFSTAFLEYRPIEQMADPNNPEVSIDKYTQEDWLKKCILNYLFASYLRGKSKLMQKSVIYDPNVVE